MSFSWPPVRIKRQGLPSPSTVICTLVLNPPRLRPNAGHLDLPFFRGAGHVRMGADNGTVNNQVFRIRVIGQIVMQSIPNAPVPPAGTALIDGVPVAVFGGPETPGRAGRGNPEYAGSETAAMVFAADVEVGAAAAEESKDFVPLAGRQFQISHAVNDNTKYQHGLGPVDTK